MHGWPEMEKHVTDEADRLTASMVRSQFLLVGRAACLASRQSGIDVPARSWELEWTAGKGAGETSCERMGSCKAPGHESLADRLLGLAQDVHQNSPAQSRKWGCACCRTMETPISRWDLSKGRKAKQTHMSQEYEQSWEGIQHIHTSARTCTHTYMTVHAQSHTHAYIHLPYNLHFFYKHHITPRRTTSHHIASHHMT